MDHETGRERERVWQRVYGMGNGFYDEAILFHQTSDDGYVVAGMVLVISGR